ncbi:MAG: hypothetical protein Q7K38_03635 [Candidatus Wildermuthbacteria bacterium]|nr:hypothetical protein [Candidatus Wildermuthbacteria bacterium]
MSQEGFLEELEKLRRGQAIDLETIAINGEEYPFKRLIMRDGIFIFQKIDTVTNGKIQYREIEPSRREALEAVRMYVERKRSQRSEREDREVKAKKGEGQ